MDRERRIERVLIDLLSDRIVERLRSRSRRALVLFSDTGLGLEPALAQLQSLRAAGWIFDAEIATGAPAGLRDRLAGLAAPDRGSAMARLRCAGLVLVPTLSLTLAAKSALGVADEPLSQLLAAAIDGGSRIVAARDGVCPDSRARRQQGLVPSSEARRALMRGHLAALSAQGVQLCWASQLAAKAAAAISSTVSGQAPAAPGRVASPSRVAVPGRVAEGVFGLRAARAWPGDELRLAREVVLTPLAAEELVARGIRLVKE